MYRYWVPCCWRPVIPLDARPAPSYPEVEVSSFRESAMTMQEFIKEAEGLVEKIHDDESYAGQIMMAAQQSDDEKVVNLLGEYLSSPFQTAYNPDRLKVTLGTSGGRRDCCRLTLILRWR
ncbi:hypothetical protein GLW04_04575 [Halobacillus litoralis]|uniref:Uncharacterized protein n=1 Tax=Halobacillus litoralis TaxID=45668 RepID=A0A845DP24_9BACI|nr:MULTISPECIES: hypothetical protein [Halobacillus]MYL19153.1 hypothetical protein [Halobacillus litoralis]MYL28299.1 hypothetical protein [Halobacillus halophilus]